MTRRTQRVVPLRSWIATITYPSGAVVTGTVYGVNVTHAEESATLERGATSVVILREVTR